MVPRTRIPMLEEMVEKLRNGDQYKQTVAHYDAPGGPVIGEGLFRTDEVAIMLAFVPAGCDFPRHLHDEAETMIVYRGELRVSAEGQETILEPGESMTIVPGIAHSASAIVDTCVVAVTVPGSKGFPDGKR